MRVAIVGAGIVGCVTAREIAARWPDASVVVLDRDVIGGGATLRSAGLHLPRGGSERVRRMSAYSQSYYEQLRDAVPSLPIRPLGMSVVACEASEPQVRASYLESARLTRVAGAWLGDGCHHADVRGVALAVARDLRPRVSFREGVRVTAIQPGGDAATLDLSTGDSLRADRVVLAPGPWVAAPAWRELLAPQGVRVKKIVSLHVDRSPSDRDGVVVFEDEDAFLLPLADRGHWLFSYTSQEWDVDPDTVAAGLSPRDAEEALDCLRRHAPELAERWSGGRVFCDAYSVEREPVVRALDPAGRVVFAGAACGSGYRLAPAIAREAVDLL